MTQSTTTLQQTRQALARSIGQAAFVYGYPLTETYRTCALQTAEQARLRPGSEIVTEAVGLDAHVRDADLVVTGEGRIDGQTAFGKTPVGVARVAKRHNKPVIAIGGSLRHDVDAVFAHGIDAVSSVLYRPCTIDEALTEGNENLRRAARNIAAILAMGLNLGASHTGR